MSMTQNPYDIAGFKCENGLTIEERNSMVVENDWIVGYIIKKFEYIRGIDRSDIAQNIRTFMLRGAEIYDKTKGTKPSTHLVNWAYAGAYDYLYENRNVHIPRNVINEQIALNKKGIGNSNRIVNAEISIENTSLAPDLNKNTKSSLNKDGICKNIVSSLSADLEIEHCDTELSEHFSFLVNKKGILSPIEKFTIRHYFGIDGEQPKTLQQVSSISADTFGKKCKKTGKIKGYSVMGIKKVRDRALSKLSKTPEAQDVLI